MPRDITLSFRKEAEAQFSDEVDLCFVTITHPELIDPIRVVWDTKDFVYGGNTFIGFPFDIQILSDDENPPKAQLSIQNVDSRIGETLRALSRPPRLKIELLSSLDFNTAVDPRVESAGLDPNTVLLLHCDGADASTTFTDSSASAHVVTANGNAQIDTAQSVFGGASGLFDGVGDYLSLDGSSGFAFGTSDFKIDFRLRRSVVGTQQNLIDFRGTGAGTQPVIYINLNTVRWFFSGDQITGTTSLLINTWYDVTVSRVSGNTRLFINGVQEGSTYVDSNNYTIGTNGPLIGASVGATFPLTGWMDEIQILNGTGVSANFTPETAAYGSGGATVVYSADSLMLVNVKVDFLTISADIVGWDYLQRTWPGKRAMQSTLPGLFR